MINELIQSLNSKNFTPRSEQKLPHVFSTYSETSPADTSNNFKSLLPRCLPCKTQRCEMLDASYLVTGSSIILGNLGFNNDLRIELTFNK